MAAKNKKNGKWWWNSHKSLELLFLSQKNLILHRQQALSQLPCLKTIFFIFILCWFFGALSPGFKIDKHCQFKQKKNTYNHVIIHCSILASNANNLVVFCRKIETPPPRSKKRRIYAKVVIKPLTVVAMKCVCVLMADRLLLIFRVNCLLARNERHKAITTKKKTTHT